MELFLHVESIIAFPGEYCFLYADKHFYDQVALLSAMVGPHVAAAAAQAAVAAIAEEEPSVSQLPIMQTPNVQSTLQKNTSQSLQKHPARYTSPSNFLLGCSFNLLSLLKCSSFHLILVFVFVFVHYGDPSGQRCQYLA